MSRPSEDDGVAETLALIRAAGVSGYTPAEGTPPTEAAPSSTRGFSVVETLALARLAGIPGFRQSADGDGQRS